MEGLLISLLQAVLIVLKIMGILKVSWVLVLLPSILVVGLSVLLVLATITTIMIGGSD